MRFLAFKLFTLLLAALLLLSFTVPVSALPLRYYLAIRDLDEQPLPHKSAARFFIIPLSWGGTYLVVLVQVEKKSSAVSDENSTDKPSKSPRVDGQI